MCRSAAECKRLATLNLVQHIADFRASFDRLTAEQRAKCAEIATASVTIDQLRQDVSGQEATERNLIDSRELLQLRAEETQLQQQLTELAKDMTDQDFRSVSREKDTLLKRQDVIAAKRSECTGQISELRSQQEQRRRELELPKYRDAIRNYRECNYDYKVTLGVANDLGKYRMALEWAMMQFHKEKMDLINREIRHLWHTIYRGNDVDYIQIRMGNLDDQSLTKKRNYDYRVVQIKNNTELDMRGRCSAGQRVLASLIIRIVLAETFSANCGVLALDEPTTNLDKKNIASLVTALQHIVTERAQQRNFMLLIITHDNEFIKMLRGNENHWLVTRSAEGKSMIQLIEPVQAFSKATMPAPHLSSSASQM